MPRKNASRAAVALPVDALFALIAQIAAEVVFFMVLFTAVHVPTSFEHDVLQVLLAAAFVLEQGAAAIFAATAVSSVHTKLRHHHGVYTASCVANVLACLGYGVFFAALGMLVYTPHVWVHSLQMLVIWALAIVFVVVAATHVHRLPVAG